MAFDRFIRQADAQGRAYGEGYDPLCFQGLSPEETEKVAERLIVAARNGDTVAIDGLGISGLLQAKDILEDLLERFEPPSDINASVGFSLWKIEPDERWQKEIAKNLSGDENAKKIAVTLLCNTAETTKTRYSLDVFLKILKESDDSYMRAQAAEGAIECCGFPPLINHATADRIALLRKWTTCIVEDLSTLLRETILTAGKEGYPVPAWASNI
jgi:hypothetical protein